MHKSWDQICAFGNNWVSVWRVKVEREGILDKAALFEIEVPPLMQESMEGMEGMEGTSPKDETAASMAFYARVFALKVRYSSSGSGAA